MEELPIYSSELIKLLDERFPHKCPNINDSEREIFLYSGKRAIIDELLNLLELESNKDNIQQELNLINNKRKRK